MKNICFILMGFVSLAHAQTKTPVFRITGQIKGLAENSAVFLTDANRNTDTVSRGTVKAGVFTLKGHLAEPNLLELNLGSAKKKTTLFIGNEEVRIEGTALNLATLKVSGSESNRDFMEFQQIFNPYFSRLTALSQQINSPEGASKRDSLEQQYYMSVAKIQSNVDSFIVNKSSSYVSPFVLVVVNQLSDDVHVLENRFTMLSPSVQQSMYGKYLSELIANGKIGAIGTEALDFTQSDTAGTAVTLSSFKGKYVLVDFWASWCRPCRMENPNVVAAFGKFKNKNFTILGVSLDRDRMPWVKAINDDHLSWSQVSDLKFWNNEVAVKYRIQQIPQNILIDPNGKIVGRNLRGSDLDNRLCELLGCN